MVPANFMSPLSKSTLNSSNLHRWLFLAGMSALVGIAVGLASAFFLWFLDVATHWHWKHPWLLWLLPLGGMAVAALYHVWGKNSERGTDLLIDEIDNPKHGVPLRMAPLIMLGTWMTHWFGGSAGREGTAVQMGGSLAGGLARVFRTGPETTRLLLMAGVAAGFGAVFGTPAAGAVFAMEFVSRGRFHFDALFPVVVAAFVANAVCSATGIHHTDYHGLLAKNFSWQQSFNFLLLGKIALAGVAFGVVSRAFSELMRGTQKGMARLIAFAPLRPLLGGLLVIALVWMAGTRDYLGLGVTAGPGGQVSITDAFHAGGSYSWSWLWKLVFTVVTVGCGFKGGEVTPLFFIGATLGHVLGVGLGDSPALFAALGLVAVLAGATKTPVACVILGMELFGIHGTLYFATACSLAFFASGKKGIYG